MSKRHTEDKRERISRGEAPRGYYDHNAPYDNQGMDYGRFDGEYSGVQDVAYGGNSYERRQPRDNGRVNDDRHYNNKVLHGGEYYGNYEGDSTGYYDAQYNNFMDSAKQAKKKGTKWVGIVASVFFGLTAVAIAGFGGYYYFTQYSPPEIKTPEEYTGRKALDTFLAALRDYDKKELLGSIVSDVSYINQEEDYANANETELDFIKTICSTVKFTYPEAPRINKRGEMVDKLTGEVQTKMSDMTDGEATYVTYIDYDAILENIRSDKTERKKILQGVKANEISKKSLTYKEEMTDYFMEYIMSLDTIPVKTEEVKIPLSSKEAEDGYKIYKVRDDIEMDNLLFGSDELHRLMDYFGRIASNYKTKVTKTVKKETEVEVENPDYPLWVQQVQNQQSIDAQTGVVSVYPELQKDAAGNVVNDENGNPIILRTVCLQIDASGNLVLDENGNTIEVPEPSPTIKQKKTTKKKVTVKNTKKYKSESVIPYTWIGAYYLQNIYKDGINIQPQSGDGSFERPAAKGTSVLTKAYYGKGKKRKVYDIKITLTGMWTGEDAVEYLEGFSEKNRGFLTDSSLKLVCFEYEVQNLSKKTIVVSDNTVLTDMNANQSPRTGKVFGLTTKVKLKKGQKKTIQTWATSTELDRKYLIWGKNFKRKYPVVWFNVLAYDTQSNGSQTPQLDDSAADGIDSTGEGVANNTNTQQGNSQQQMGNTQQGNSQQQVNSTQQGDSQQQTSNTQQSVGAESALRGTNSITNGTSTSENTSS